jgi:hypothetical protein
MVALQPPVCSEAPSHPICLPTLCSKMMGTISDVISVACHTNICIVHPSAPISLFEKLGPIKFLFCTDSSHAAAQAFCYLITLIMRPQDTVDVVSVTSSITSSGQPEGGVVKRYHASMVEKGISGTAYAKCIDLNAPGMNIAAGMIDAVSERQADVLVMGTTSHA